MYAKQFDLLVDLISRILVWGPDRRIAADKALKHPFFQSNLFGFK